MSIKDNSMPTKSMGMDTYTFSIPKTRKSTLVIGLMALSMVLESKSIIQVKHIKETSSQASEMESDYYIIKMTNHTLTKDNSMMATNMEMAQKYLSTEIHTLAPISKTNSMDKANIHGKMEPFTKEPFIKD